ncbi:hypothetical protein [Duganella radicis]|uniref:Uncharacterized protein n=1 Tax=Duganella radicis TaxID=551988 RepID=A0A6L6PLT0_9BURK|nr:hypothetical protein [Duganella radicis]MTV39567.1 hypothetical protein [Duganella radicis]
MFPAISRTQSSLAGIDPAPEPAPGAGGAESAGSPMPDAPARLPPAATTSGSSRTLFVNQIAGHDKQLASYLMGRRVVGREIEGEELARLRQANNVLQESREALHIGRGNVTTDIAATDGRSALTCSAARVVRKSKKLDELPMHRAAIAEIAGAGNCGEHSAVAAHKLAARLSENEEVHSVYNRAADHGWAEVRTSPPDQRPAIVVDAWGEGPAIHAEDALFASSAIPAEQRVSDFSYDARTAPAALADKANFLAEQGGVIEGRIDAVRKRLPAHGFEQRKVFNPTPIIDPAFANDVSEKMSDLHDMTMFRLDLPALESADFRNKLLATSVLRELGASVKEATAAAAEVSSAAGALARAPQNPARSHAALQAQAAEIQRSAQRPLLDLFPSGPSDEGALSRRRGRDPGSDDEHDARDVRQRRT